MIQPVAARPNRPIPEQLTLGSYKSIKTAEKTEGNEYTSVLKDDHSGLHLKQFDITEDLDHSMSNSETGSDISDLVLDILNEEYPDVDIPEENVPEEDGMAENTTFAAMAFRPSSPGRNILLQGQLLYSAK